MIAANMKYLILFFASFILLSALNADKRRVETTQDIPQVSDTSLMKDPSNLTGSWQLLVDDYLIDKKQNIKRTYHPFKKHHANPVLVADKPWEGNISYAYGTVLPNEENNGYRLWYHSWNGEYSNLYATSSDGFTWVKPELGMFNYKGSTANNIFHWRTKSDHLPQVIHTPFEKDPGRRYKLINYDYGRTKPNNLISGFWGAYSADGIHWTDAARNPVLKDPGDVGNFVWDGHKNRYTGYPKVFSPVRGFNRRCIGFTATTDFENWPSARLILEPDEPDDYWISQPYQRTEFYGLTAFPYESGYIGFLWIFHITDGINDGPIFCELVSSRDGINWIRQEVQEGKRLPVLPVGPKGSWDQGMVFTTNHPLVEQDLVKLWYGGFTATHGGGESETAGVGFATLRKDGFASLDATGSTGSITTLPMKNLKGELRINADAKGGMVKVEVLDKDGVVLPGYSRKECKAIQTDETDIKVGWNRHKSLPAGPGPYRLRFILQNASLFSFHGGEELELAYTGAPDKMHLTFTKNGPQKKSLSRNKATGIDRDAVKENYRFHGKITIEKDADNLKTGTWIARFPSAVPDSSNRIELMHTSHPGASFTLAATVKLTGNKLTRLFSNYRGSGEPVTGELIFDVDPSGHEIPGLRFMVNGQAVLSKPLKFDDGGFHQFVVTYDMGKVNLYMDGIVVGSGNLESGSAQLRSNKKVHRYFEEPHSLPEVGIHLGGNLFVGGDLSGRFINYKDEKNAASKAALTGSVREVLFERKALSDLAVKEYHRQAMLQSR